jgi:ornithine carbamoyltransferase
VEILDVARQLKAEVRAGIQRPLLSGRVLGMVFQKPSLRTRVSFEVAMRQTGGHAIYLSPDEVQIGRREAVADVARVLSRYVDAIVARTFAHRDVEELAGHASVPVVNGLSDLSHPCQGLADYLTIQEHFGRLRGIRLAYVGDGNNVAHSLILGGALLGVHVAVASPRSYECNPQVVARAQALAGRSGSVLTFTTDPGEAARDADVIYTDVWTSMGQEAEREQRSVVFRPYQVNQSLVALARPGAIVMHCLPAHRGEEITEDIFEDPRSVVFDQAENRLHSQKAVLVLLLGARPRGDSA